MAPLVSRKPRPTTPVCMRTAVAAEAAIANGCIATAPSATEIPRKIRTRLRPGRVSPRVHSPFLLLRNGMLSTNERARLMSLLARFDLLPYEEMILSQAAPCIAINLVDPPEER